MQLVEAMILSSDPSQFVASIPNVTPSYFLI